MVFARDWDPDKKLGFRKSLTQQLNNGKLLTLRDVYDQAKSERWGFTQSDKTLSRFLGSYGFSFGQAYRKKVLTLKHKQQRVTFARDTLHKIDPRTVLMGDSAFFMKEVREGLRKVSFWEGASCSFLILLFRWL
jgi:hypothetical protein